MKTTLTTTLLLLSIAATSQIRLEDVRFDAFIYTEPQHYVLSDNRDALIHVSSADGFNIGAAIEYQSNIFYAKAATYFFPDLKGANYIDLGGSFGINWQSEMRFWRAYIGFCGARIWRDGDGDYANMGGEAGVDYYFSGWNNGLFVGIQGSIVSATDSKLWSPNDDTLTRRNLGLKLGFTF